MKKHFCILCNYQTDLLYNYNKHLKTKKHHKLFESGSNRLKIGSLNEPIGW